ncbi:MAG: hypothetical protein DWQ10_11200 [Calditrichaeota bacterium]|nr:MAG: hypothetical protein DWQ10_11200 [Calditrichota bacterium]
MWIRYSPAIGLFSVLLVILNCDNNIVQVTSSDLQADPVQLTFDGKTKLQPAWSNDGKRIAYIANEAVTTVAAHSTAKPVDEPLGLFHGNKNKFTDFAIDASGTQLLSVRLDRKSLIFHDLTLGVSNEIDTATELAHPQWDQSGENFGYIKNQNTIAIRSKSGGIISETTVPNAREIVRFAYHAAAMKLAIELKGEAHKIVIYDFAEQTFQDLTDANNDCRFPAWSRDGQHLAFVQSTENGAILHIFDFISNEMNDVLNYSKEMSHLIWRSTDNTIRFYADGRIVDFQVDSSRLAPDDYWDEQPIWYRSGEAVLALHTQQIGRLNVVDINTKEITFVDEISPSEFNFDTLATDMFPNWSSNDATIQIIKSRKIKDFLQVVKIDLLTGDESLVNTSLTQKTTREITPLFRLSRSQSGQRFVYNAGASLVLEDENGNVADLSQIVTEPLVQPVWFTDDKHLAAIHHAENTVKLVKLNAAQDAADIIPIDIPGFSGTVEGVIADIVFSNNHEILGARLAFTYQDAIYIFYLSGFKIEQLIAHGQYPAFSPDGESIVFIHENELKIIKLFYRFD